MPQQSILVCEETSAITFGKSQNFCAHYSYLPTIVGFNTCRRCRGCIPGVEPCWRLNHISIRMTNIQCFLKCVMFGKPSKHQNLALYWYHLGEIKAHGGMEPWCICQTASVSGLYRCGYITHASQQAHLSANRFIQFTSARSWFMSTHPNNSSNLPLPGTHPSCVSHTTPWGIPAKHHMIFLLLRQRAGKQRLFVTSPSLQGESRLRLIASFPFCTPAQPQNVAQTQQESEPISIYWIQESTA